MAGWPAQAKFNHTIKTIDGGRVPGETNQSSNASVDPTTRPPVFYWPIPRKRVLVHRCLLLGMLGSASFVTWTFWIDGTQSHISAYTGLSILLLLAVSERIFIYPTSAAKARLVDASMIRALTVEASTVEPRSPVGESDGAAVKPDNYEQKKKDLLNEVDRLEQMGPTKWTEYQVLPLKQMLVDFNKVDDLKAQAQSILAELRDYSEDSLYRYDEEHYGQWKERINSASEAIDVGSEIELDAAAERLRAEVRTVLDHVTDYQENWARGSVLIRSLYAACAAAVPILAAMGLLPALLSRDCAFLQLGHWGLLGAAGSVTAVMLSLRKSDVAEVGNTLGKREIWRAILGAVLGLMAGILAFGIIAGGLLSGTAVPEIHSAETKDIGLTIVWAIGSGISLERIFDRVRNSTEIPT